MINKLISNIRKTNAPIVVGLDPMLNYIPEHIQKKAFAEYGETLEGAAEAIWQFNKEIIDKTYDLIPAVKPQIAMYEQFGIPGLEAFSRTVKYAKEKNLVIIGDVKRGDIGSTSAAYAAAHLGRVNVGTKSSRLDRAEFTCIDTCLSQTVLAVIGYDIAGDRTVLTGRTDNLNYISIVNCSRCFSLSKSDTLADDCSFLINTTSEVWCWSRNDVEWDVVSYLI